MEEMPGLPGLGQGQLGRGRLAVKFGASQDQEGVRLPGQHAAQLGAGQHLVSQGCGLIAMAGDQRKMRRSRRRVIMTGWHVW